MLPKRWLGICLLSSGLVTASFVRDEKQAFAQDVIDLDEESDEEVDRSPSSGPVTVGPGSSEAREAKKLFDAQKWDQAALALFRVAAGETQDDAANQQLAQYYLAISLYHLKLYQASYALFSLVAET